MIFDDLKKWSNVHKKRFVWLMNMLKRDKPEWFKDNADTSVNGNIIENHKNGVIKYLENAELANTSVEALYYLVARYLENKGDKVYSEKFRSYGQELKAQNEQKEGGNQMDGKEIENLRPLNYYKQIVDEYNFLLPLKKDKLLLAMMVLQPPLRNGFYTKCRIVKRKSDINDTDNFLYLDYKSKKAYYYVNSDKVSNTREYSKKKNKTIPIISNVLTEHFLKYYKEEAKKRIFI